MQLAEPELKPTAKGPAPDAPLWPVLALLPLLVCFAISPIVALDRFDDPLWYANTKTHLLALGLGTLAVMAILSRLNPRRVRRGLQFAALTSLIVHVGLLTLLESHQLPEISLMPPDGRYAKPSEPVTIVREFEAPGEPHHEDQQPVFTVKPDDSPAELTRRDPLHLGEQPADDRAPAEQPSLTDVPLADAPLADIEPGTLELPEAERRATDNLTPTLPAAPSLPAPSTAPVAPQLAAEVPALEAPETSAPQETESQPARRALDTAALPTLPAAEEPLPRAAAVPLDTALPANPVAQAPQSPLIPVTPEVENMARRAPLPAQPDLPAGQVPLPELEASETARESAVPDVPLPARSAIANQLSERAIQPAETPLDRPAPPTAALTPGAMPLPKRSLNAQETPAAIPSGAEPALVPARQTLEAVPQTARIPAPTDGFDSPMTDVASDRPAGPDIGPAMEKRSTTRPDPAAFGASQANNQPASTLPAGALSDTAPSPAELRGADEPLGPNLGVPDRRPAPPEPRIARSATAPALTDKASAPLKIDGRSREPTPAFARRGGQRRDNVRSVGEPNEETQAAIELGLDYLARRQSRDGSWKLDYLRDGKNDGQPSFRSATAASGLALLSFLGAGYDHFGGRHAEVVDRALKALLKHQKPDGDLYQAADMAANPGGWLYGHGIAAIALTEAYGMTGDKSLAAAAQKSIDFIVAAQDPQRGAWRYGPNFALDTSVSGWQFMALKSGELAGLKVPAATYENVKRWLDNAAAEAARPNAKAAPGARPRPVAALTAVELLMRLYTGWRRDDPRVVASANVIHRNLPERGAPTQPARDTHYWYFATQVMFQMGGTYWSDWSERLHPLLIEQQIAEGPLAGSWEPRRPLPHIWGVDGGRTYVTSLNLLSLEVFYRHLPIYESRPR